GEKCERPGQPEPAGREPRGSVHACLPCCRASPITASTIDADPMTPAVGLQGRVDPRCSFGRDLRGPRVCGSVRRMGELKFGPARVPSQESPEAAVELLLERGYTACEIDFEGRFWMDYDFATRLGELAREHALA